MKTTNVESESYRKLLGSGKSMNLSKAYFKLDYERRTNTSEDGFKVDRGVKAVM